MSKKLPAFWWINNAKDYKEDKKISYLWVPQKNRIGRENPTCQQTGSGWLPVL